MSYKQYPWLKNHTHKRSLQQEIGTILHMPVTKNFGVPATSLQVLTRNTCGKILLRKKEDQINKTDKILAVTLKDVSKRLNEDV